MSASISSDEKAAVLACTRASRALNSACQRSSGSLRYRCTRSLTTSSGVRSDRRLLRASRSYSRPGRVIAEFAIVPCHPLIEHPDARTRSRHSLLYPCPMCCQTRPTFFAPFAPFHSFRDPHVAPSANPCYTTRAKKGVSHALRPHLAESNTCAIMSLQARLSRYPWGGPESPPITSKKQLPEQNN